LSFPPKYRVSFTTPIHSNEVSSRLKTIVAETETISGLNDFKFRGRVSNVHFVFSILEPSLASFFIEVSGAIYEHPNKTKIQVTCRLPKWIYFGFILSQFVLASGAIVSLFYSSTSLLYSALAAGLLGTSYLLWVLLDRKFQQASKIVKTQLKLLFLEEPQ
jgi:hypothetical protein